MSTLKIIKKRRHKIILEKDSYKQTTKLRPVLKAANKRIKINNNLLELTINKGVQK